MLSIVSICAAVLAGQRERGILGTVWIEKATAPRVEVVLENDLGTPIGSTFTDEDGRFRFADLGPNRYRVVVNAPCCDTQDQLVDLTDVMGEHAVSVFLHPRLRKNGVQVGSPSLNAKASKSFTQGHQLLLAQRYKDAIAPLTAAAAADPGLAMAYEDLGTAYFATGNVNAAEKSWEQALRLNPSLGSAAVDLARIANDHGDTNRAATLLDSAKKAGDDAWPYHLERARVSMATKQWPTAFQELNTAISKGANSPPVYIMLASAALRTGHQPEARHAYERYLAASPSGQYAPRVRQIVQDMIAHGVPEPR